MEQLPAGHEEIGTRKIVNYSWGSAENECLRIIAAANRLKENLMLVKARVRSPRIVSANNGSDVISVVMLLIIERSGQECSRCRECKGASWEDRYHAPAMESGEHLWRCQVYSGLNMVISGVAAYPPEWKWGACPSTSGTG